MSRLFLGSCRHEMLFERHTFSQRLLEIENYFIELCDGVSATQDKEATEEEGAEEVGTVSRFGDSLEALFRVFVFASTHLLTERWRR